MPHSISYVVVIKHTEGMSGAIGKHVEWFMCVCVTHMGHICSVYIYKWGLKDRTGHTHKMYS